MSSLWSAFSAFRCSVASATDLSNALIPASRSAISWAKVSMAPSISSMADSESETDCDNAFFLSSDWSNCAPQYSFFASSPCCSFFKFATIWSIILITLSKPTFLPRSANAMRSSPGLPGIRVAIARISFNADSLRAFLAACTCTKLLALALGNVFLKRSSASSSLRTLIVSAKATSSSALFFLTSSHSCVFVAQPSSNSFLNFSSWDKAA
mmetsp:Transcript_90746/g.235346  ORF Transcript_90746/g.235346 Transcript_90746/m.235346 type:complete len:211 (+) Transcript_90746:808-1440(+)